MSSSAFLMLLQDYLTSPLYGAVGLGTCLLYVLVFFGVRAYREWRCSRKARALFDHVIERHRIDLENSDTDECAICMDSFEGGEECCVLKACNHCYHESCIRQWLSNWRTLHCPLCRRLVQAGPVARVTPAPAGS